jgi:hypothetical protein
LVILAIIPYLFDYLMKIIECLLAPTGNVRESESVCPPRELIQVGGFARKLAYQLYVIPVYPFTDATFGDEFTNDLTAALSASARKCAEPNPQFLVEP